jgi:periplasmic protein TonB
MKAKAESIILISEHLPVLGDAHPLRARYTRFLITSAIIAGSLHLVGFGAWLVGRSIHREPPMPKNVIKIVKIADLGVPPSLTNQTTAQVNVAAAVAPPSIGVPEPVPDFQAPNLTMASQQEMAQALAPTDIQSLGNSNSDSLVVQFDKGDRSPTPDEFVAYEEAPVLISLPAPVYPDMARQAEVEGVVQVRMLVGKDGKVKDAIVTDHVTMLDDAAIDAAKKAVFKPALQQHRPVEVWVQVPMRFTLH